MTDNPSHTIDARHEEDANPSALAEIGERLFEWRDYTPIPLILLALVFAKPSIPSATFGTLVAVLGELWRVYSVSFIGSVSRTRNPLTTGDALITRGPFAWVRNPLYVGNFLITFGLAVFAGHFWLVLLTAAAFAFQYHCIVLFEEKLLRDRFGPAFDEYRQTVPAWVPSHFPPVETWEWPESFGPALRSEKRTAAAVLVMLFLLALRGI